MSKRVIAVIYRHFPETSRKSGTFYYYLRVISQHAPQGAIWEGQYTRGVLIVVYRCFWQIEQEVRVDEAEIHYFELV